MNTLSPFFTYLTIAAFHFILGFIAGVSKRRKHNATPDIKTQSLLLDVANKVSNHPVSPTIEQLEDDINAFLEAVDNKDLGKQTTMGNKLIASLVKWQVNNV